MWPSTNLKQTGVSVITLALVCLGLLVCHIRAVDISAHSSGIDSPTESPNSAGLILLQLPSSAFVAYDAASGENLWIIDRQTSVGASLSCRYDPHTQDFALGSQPQMSVNGDRDYAPHALLDPLAHATPIACDRVSSLYASNSRYSTTICSIATSLQNTSYSDVHQGLHTRVGDISYTRQLRMARVGILRRSGRLQSFRTLPYSSAQSALFPSEQSMRKDLIWFTHVQWVVHVWRAGRRVNSACWMTLQPDHQPAQGIIVSERVLHTPQTAHAPAEEPTNIPNVHTPHAMNTGGVRTAPTPVHVAEGPMPVHANPTEAIRVRVGPVCAWTYVMPACAPWSRTVTVPPTSPDHHHAPHTAPHATRRGEVPNPASLCDTVAVQFVCVDAHGPLLPNTEESLSLTASPYQRERPYAASSSSYSAVNAGVALADITAVFNRVAGLPTVAAAVTPLPDDERADVHAEGSIHSSVVTLGSCASDAQPYCVPDSPSPQADPSQHDGGDGASLPLSDDTSEAAREVILPLLAAPALRETTAQVRGYVCRDHCISAHIAAHWRVDVLASRPSAVDTAAEVWTEIPSEIPLTDDGVKSQQTANSFSATAHPYRYGQWRGAVPHTSRALLRGVVSALRRLRSNAGYAGALHVRGVAEAVCPSAAAMVVTSTDATDVEQVNHHYSSRGDAIGLVWPQPRSSNALTPRSDRAYASRRHTDTRGIAFITDLFPRPLAVAPPALSPPGGAYALLHAPAHAWSTASASWRHSAHLLASRLNGLLPGPNSYALSVFAVDALLPAEREPCVCPRDFGAASPRLAALTERTLPAAKALAFILIDNKFFAEHYLGPALAHSHVASPHSRGIPTSPRTSVPRRSRPSRGVQVASTLSCNAYFASLLLRARADADNEPDSPHVPPQPLQSESMQLFEADTHTSAEPPASAMSLWPSSLLSPLTLPSLAASYMSSRLSGMGSFTVFSAPEQQLSFDICALSTVIARGLDSSGLPVVRISHTPAWCSHRATSTQRTDPAAVSARFTSTTIDADACTLTHHIDPLASREVQQTTMRRNHCGCLCKCVSHCGDSLLCIQRCGKVCSSLRAVAARVYYHEHAYLLLGAHTLSTAERVTTSSIPAYDLVDGPPVRHAASTCAYVAPSPRIPHEWRREAGVCASVSSPPQLGFMAVPLGLFNASTSRLVDKSRKLLEKLFDDINLSPGTANRTQRLLRSLERSIRRMIKLDRSLSRLEDMARAGLLYTLHSETMILLMLLVAIYAIYSLRYSIDAYRLSTRQAPVALHELLHTDALRAPGAISVFLGTWDHRRVAVKRVAKANMGTRRAGREASLLLRGSAGVRGMPHYHTSLEDNEYVYLILERADCSLAQWLDALTRQRAHYQLQMQMARVTSRPTMLSWVVRGTGLDGDGVALPQCEASDHAQVPSQIEQAAELHPLQTSASDLPPHVPAHTSGEHQCAHCYGRGLCPLLSLGDVAVAYYNELFLKYLVENAPQSAPHLHKPSLPRPAHVASPAPLTSIPQERLERSRVELAARSHTARGRRISVLSVSAAEESYTPQYATTSSGGTEPAQRASTTTLSHASCITQRVPRRAAAITTSKRDLVKDGLAKARRSIFALAAKLQFFPVREETSERAQVDFLGFDEARVEGSRILRNRSALMDRWDALKVQFQKMQAMNRLKAHLEDRHSRVRLLDQVVEAQVDVDTLMLLIRRSREADSAFRQQDQLHNVLHQRLQKLYEEVYRMRASAPASEWGSRRVLALRHWLHRDVYAVPLAPALRNQLIVLTTSHKARMQAHTTPFPHIPLPPSVLFSALPRDAQITPTQPSSSTSVSLLAALDSYAPTCPVDTLPSPLVDTAVKILVKAVAGATPDGLAPVPPPAPGPRVAPSSPPRGARGDESSAALAGAVGAASPSAGAHEGLKSLMLDLVSCIAYVHTRLHVIHGNLTADNVVLRIPSASGIGIHGGHTHTEANASNAATGTNCLLRTRARIVGWSGCVDVATSGRVDVSPSPWRGFTGFTNSLSALLGYSTAPATTTPPALALPHSCRFDHTLHMSLSAHGSPTPFARGVAHSWWQAPEFARASLQHMLYKLHCVEYQHALCGSNNMFHGFHGQERSRSTHRQPRMEDVAGEPAAYASTQSSPPHHAGSTSTDTTVDTATERRLPPLPQHVALPTYTFAADIFSLGVLLYSLFTQGKLPFYAPRQPLPSEVDTRVSSAMAALALSPQSLPSLTRAIALHTEVLFAVTSARTLCLDAIDAVTAPLCVTGAHTTASATTVLWPACEAVLFKHLIAQCLAPTPSARPSAAAILNHPFFWTDARRASFMISVSNFVHVTPPECDMLSLRSQAAAHALLRRSMVAAQSRGVALSVPVPDCATPLVDTTSGAAKLSTHALTTPPPVSYMAHRAPPLHALTNARTWLVQELESVSALTLHPHWLDEVPLDALLHMLSARSYRARSLIDCLRLFRNKEGHFREMDARQTQLLGTDTTSRLAFFARRAPYLLLHVFILVSRTVQLGDPGTNRPHLPPLAFVNAATRQPASGDPTAQPFAGSLPVDVERSVARPQFLLPALNGYRVLHAALTHIPLALVHAGVRVRKRVRGGIKRLKNKRRTPNQHVDRAAEPDDQTSQTPAPKRLVVDMRTKARDSGAEVVDEALSHVSFSQESASPFDACADKHLRPRVSRVTMPVPLWMPADATPSADATRPCSAVGLHRLGHTATQRTCGVATAADAHYLDALTYPYRISGTSLGSSSFSAAVDAVEGEVRARPAAVYALDAELARYYNGLSQCNLLLLHGQADDLVTAAAVK